MTDKEILNKMTAIFRDIFDDELLVITEETGHDDLEEWDSLAHITVILSVEKEFGVKFDIEEIGKLATVGDILKVVKENMIKGNES